MNPKRFSILVTATSGLAFAVIAAGNWIVNPYAQYGPSIVPPVVQTSRSTKVKLLGNMSPAPSGLVLGSSRVMKLEPSYLEARFQMGFFNAGVNYGKPEDHLAMLRFYRRKFGQYPKLIVLGLDVHGFSDTLPFDARLLSNTPLVREIKAAVPFEARFHRWKQLLSWQQTRASLKSLHRNPHGKPPAESFNKDGLLIYHDRERLIDEGTYDFDAAISYNKREYKQLFANFEKLSSHRIELFQSLASTCRQHNTRLLVFMTPVHPALAEYLAETSYSKRRDELARVLRNLASVTGFAFCDCSDIQSFGGDAANFVDGIHPLESNTRRIIDHLVRQTEMAEHYVVQ